MLNALKRVKSFRYPCLAAKQLFFIYHITYE
nr:MAG TPA: hypothetical protein [Caudoviricetes sp.]